MLAASVGESIEYCLMAEPLTDEHMNWSVGGKPMDNGDECWVVARVDLDEAPRRVEVEEVACYPEQPETTPDGAFVGRGTVRAAAADNRCGQAGRFVLTDVSSVVSPA